MAEYLIQDTTLTDIADAIRTKKKSSETINVSDFASQIETIETEEEVAAEIDFTEFETESKIVETFEDGTSKTSVIEYDENGMVSKVIEDGKEISYTFDLDDEGYIKKISDSEGNETVVTGEIKTKPQVELLENVVIPVDFSNGDQTVVAEEGQAVKSAIIPKPAELVAENIKENTTIAGIAGTLPVYELTEKNVGLDFSAGNMNVSAESRKPFSKVTINKPETLVAENIAEGVNIAGIVGALVAGSKVKINGGTFNGSYNSFVTVQHGLGVLPDIIIVKKNFDISAAPSYPYIEFALGVSSAFRKATVFDGYYLSGSTTYGRNTSNVQHSLSGPSAVHTATDRGNGINNTNENSFQVGTNSNKTAPTSSSNTKYQYVWIAISGLT